MKRIISSLAAKMTAIILAVVFAAVCAVNTVAAVVILLDGAYDSEKQFKEKYILNPMLQEYERIEEYAESVYQGDKATAEFYCNYFSKENSNLFFTVETKNGEYEPISNYTDQYIYSTFITTEYVVAATEKVTDIKVFETAAQRWEYITRCETLHENVEFEADDEDVDGDGDYECTLEISYEKVQRVPVSVKMYVRKNMTADDEYSLAMKKAQRLYDNRFVFIVLAVAGLVGFLAVMVFLVCAAGHKKGSEGITLNWLDCIPFDLYLGVAIGFFFLSMSIVNDLNSAVPFVIAAGMWLLIVISLIMTFATRAKAGTLFKNTVIFRLLVLLKLLVRSLVEGTCKLLKALPLIWEVVLGWVGLVIIELVGFVIVRNNFGVGDVFGFLAIKNLIIGVPLVYVAICLSKLEKGGERIAKGDVDYKVETDTMIIPAFKRHAENLNNMGDGITHAVNEKLKSERLKTELITNVSHDIKTPLTSIVNYAGLLRDVVDDPKKTDEYISVIERHSARLRKLIDDLVEASRASTGNITFQLERTDINLLLAQSCGEYTERLHNAEIELVLDVEEKVAYVMADGRLLWRVFDNLMCNVCKYALKGTRLYVSSAVQNNSVVITFKNISGMPLNISGDELMERFVRGDASRSTEGSGLGLSIAGSLVTLQGGKFSIDVDGDLFKATIELELC